MPTTLPILHFNDVYRVGPQKIAGKGTIDVTQFANMLDSLRDGWPLRSDGAHDGLVLFSGDLFAPSVESSVTRGSHMVPVINELGPDVAVTGNHEFDFGYPQLKKLVNDTNFPWLLSNIIDETTSRVPEGLHEFYIMERCSVKIGFIGLVEREWISTVPSWPPSFKYRDMSEVAFELSKSLRDPEGDFRCDFVIALTHSRLPNDIRLAKSIKAFLPSRQPPEFASMHGVDLILGGHDHFYYAPKGIESWPGLDLHHEIPGAGSDDGDVAVVKSGTDFRELSELALELEDAPAGSTRRKVLKYLRGKRHETCHNSAPSQRMKDILSMTLTSVSETLRQPLFKVVNQIDLRSEVIRTCESASGNWFADVIHHAYDEALYKMGIEGTDGVLLCAGALRGDTLYGPGDITLGDIMEILPFDDSIVALQMDGRTIWQAFEAGLSRWPASEGRFPVVSGFRVKWDSRRPPGDRVLSIHVPRRKRADVARRAGDLTEEYEVVEREGEERKFIAVTREYMADGHDGYTCLKGQRMVIDKEQGRMMSAIVQKYLQEHPEAGKLRDLPESGQAAQSITKSTYFVVLEQMIRIVKNELQLLGSQTLDRAKIRWNLLVGYAITLARFAAHRLALTTFPSSGPVNRATGANEKCLIEQGARPPVEKARTEDILIAIPLSDGRLDDIGRM